VPVEGVGGVCVGCLGMQLFTAVPMATSADMSDFSRLLMVAALLACTYVIT